MEDAWLEPTSKAKPFSDRFCPKTSKWEAFQHSHLRSGSPSLSTPFPNAPYYDVAEKQNNTKNMDQFGLQTDDLARADIHEGRSRRKGRDSLLIGWCPCAWDGPLLALNGHAGQRKPSKCHHAGTVRNESGMPMPTISVTSGGSSS